MAHPDCLKEFDTKGELECRCVPLYGKVSTLKLKNAGKLQEASFIKTYDMTRHLYIYILYIIYSTYIMIFFKKL